MGFSGDVMDTVRLRSENKTVEKLTTTNDDYDALRLESTNASPAYIQQGATGTESTGQARITFRPGMNFYAGPVPTRVIGFSGSSVLISVPFIPLADNTFDIGTASGPLRFKDIYLAGNIIGGGYTGDFVVNGDIYMDGATTRTLYGGDDASDKLILRANSSDAGPTMEFPGAGDPILPGGVLEFVAADKGRLIDDGSSIKILYGAIPDFGIGIGGASGAPWHFDIQSDGVMDTLSEQVLFVDAAFSYPHRQFCEINATFRTAGDCLSVIGSQVTLTTGRLFTLFSNGSGPGGTPSFMVDKLGKVWIADSTETEQASFQRTLDDLIIDSETGAGLSIRIENVEVIGDNRVSELALGNTTMIPKIPVITTIERNALTPTTGMIIYNSTVNNFQGRSNVAWVNL